MISEGLLGAFSLVKLKRDILWLGAQNENPPEQLGPLLSRIQFVPFQKSIKLSPKKNLSALVVSYSEEAPLSEELLRNLNLVDSDVIRFLVLPKGPLTKKCIDLINQVHFAQVFNPPDDFEILADQLNFAIENLAKSRLANENRQKVRSESQQLENHTSDLEGLVRDRTFHVQMAKREIEAKVSRVRGLIRFLKDLALVVSIEDLLQLLRKEAKSFHEVKEPLLAYRTQAQENLCLYFQGSSVLKKTDISSWPGVDRIQLNHKPDSQYLADLFGRPFAQVLSIPLNIRRTADQTQSTTPAVLYIEHSLGEESRTRFIEFIEQRLQPVSLALDRVFLEHDLREASLLWERTFDGITDPIAIFDSDTHLIRSNSAFQKRLSSLSAEELFKDKVNQDGRVYEVQTYPITGGDGEVPTNVVIHFVDVTVAHQLQKQMIQQEKMAALGHMAGNIAHELNNPLTGIRSLSQVLIHQTQDRESICSDLVEVEKAAARCQSIITNLLEFSRGGVGVRQVDVPLSSLVDRTLPLLKTLLSRFDTQVKHSESNIRVRVEPQLMQQVVFNLIKNAGQAMEDGDRLRISTGSESVNEKEMAYIRVEDSGQGISPELQGQVFDFFFTTKEEGQGTGLGLSMSQSIVKQFGGEIVLTSELGRGSVFTVYLPMEGTRN